MPPVEMEWPQRVALAAASGAGETVTYDDLLRAAGSGDFRRYYERFLFGSVSENLAARFGTKGSPIATSTACASGGTAIQLGVEAIFTILSLRHGLLPPTINYDTPDPALPIDCVPNVARAVTVKHAISNSFGFGGQNVCLVLGAAPG